MRERTDWLEENGIAKIAAGVVLGLAAWNLVAGFVGSLVVPFIAAFIGAGQFQMNSFMINGSEFSYGYFLEDLLVFGAVVLLLWLVVPALLDHVRRR